MAKKIAGVIFLLVAIAHLLRLIFKAKVIIASFIVPMWMSGIAAVVTLLLSIWMLKSKS